MSRLGCFNFWLKLCRKEISWIIFSVFEDCWNIVVFWSVSLSRLVVSAIVTPVFETVSLQQQNFMSWYCHENHRLTSQVELKLNRHLLCQENVSESDVGNINLLKYLECTFCINLSSENVTDFEKSLSTSIDADFVSGALLDTRGLTIFEGRAVMSVWLALLLTLPEESFFNIGRQSPTLTL